MSRPAAASRARTIRLAVGALDSPDGETARALAKELATAPDPWAVEWVGVRRLAAHLGPPATVHFGPRPGRACLIFQSLPDPNALADYLRRHPESWVAVPHREMAHGLDPDRWRVLPLLLPDDAFESHDAAVYRAAVTYHLEARPRVVVVGTDDGRGVTRALRVAMDLMRHDGELVLTDALERRAAWAPMIQRMGLVERVVWLPAVSATTLRAILHGADLLLAPSPPARYPYEILCATAAGVPVVALNDPLYRLASGDAAILVEPDREDAWTPAVRDALQNERRRARMLRWGRTHAEQYRAKTAIQAWMSVLTPATDHA
jgi:glycosyltransferase involved in cell wall biosynthesis